MNIKSFLKLVEIQTKVASLIPFILGILFSMYRYGRVDAGKIALFFLSLICIDMATTAINNYMDYLKAVKKEGYNYETHNAITSHDLSTKTVRITIFSLLGISIISGLYLFYITDIVVLIIGIISVSVGILYSFGPVPISRTPYGEVFSGVVMGGFIFFITIYIQIFDMNIIDISVNQGVFLLSFNIKEILIIFLVSIPLISMIANIMLANNICDMDDDKINGRLTLPLYIGKTRSLIVFTSLYILSYLIITFLIIYKLLPLLCVMVLFTGFPLIFNIKKFLKLQDKAKTFELAVKNFILFSLVWILTLLVVILQ